VSVDNRFGWGFAAVLCAFAWIPRASSALPANVQNPTGLPVYPRLADARLEDRLRTDDFGRWCVHLNAWSLDSLATVENWYRTTLSTASETDLRRDGDYGSRYFNLDGIKLATNLSFVAVYQPARGAVTSIEMVRCGLVR
jgi:hypothetical protein